jgi:transglutaminase-like putative cysteine protease
MKSFTSALCIVAAIATLYGCGTAKKSYKYNWDKDLHHRILADFTKTEPEVKDYIRKYIPDVTDEQMRQWEESKDLECMTIDGEKRYFKNAGPNLFRVNPECKAIKDAISPSPEGYERIDAINVPAIINSAKSTGNAIGIPKKMHIRYTLTVKADAVPDGEMIRCWLPFPRKDQSRQKDVVFIGASEPKYVFSPNGSIHSTLYMEKKAVKGQPTVFWEEFEYVSYGEWDGIAPENVRQYSPGAKGSLSKKDYKYYTSEREAQIKFSPRLRNLADSLTRGIDNPYLQAKAIFKWINYNFPWASAREYSTIPNIPEYVLDNGHGDCGQVSLLFITLCRIKGIPAHFESGFMMHPEGLWNMHDWAEVYFEGIGWVPADQSFGIPTYAKKDSDEEFFFLGGIDSYRMIVNEDFGKALFPAKKYPRSETVDFQRGEVEWEGGNLYFPEWKYSMKIDYLDGNV